MESNNMQDLMACLLACANTKSYKNYEKSIARRGQDAEDEYENSIDEYYESEEMDDEELSEEEHEQLAEDMRSNLYYQDKTLFAYRNERVIILNDIVPKVISNLIMDFCVSDYEVYMAFDVQRERDPDDDFSM